MSGEVQPRRRRDKKKRKAQLAKEDWDEGKALYGTEDADDEDGEQAKEPLPDLESSNSEEEEESREESETSTGMSYKVIFFLLLLVFGVAVGLLLADNQSTGEQNEDSVAEGHDPVSIPMSGSEVNQIWQTGGETLEDDDKIEEPEVISEHRDDGLTSFLDTIGGLFQDFLEVNGAGDGHDAEPIASSTPEPTNPSEEARIESDPLNLSEPGEINVEAKESADLLETNQVGNQGSADISDEILPELEKVATQSEELGSDTEPSYLPEEPEDKTVESGKLPDGAEAKTGDWLFPEAEIHDHGANIVSNEANEQFQSGERIGAEFRTDVLGEIVDAWKVTEAPEENFETQIREPLESDASAAPSLPNPFESMEQQTVTEAPLHAVSDAEPVPVPQPSPSDTRTEPAVVSATEDAAPATAGGKPEDIPNPEPDGGVTEDEILIDGML